MGELLGILSRLGIEYTIEDGFTTREGSGESIPSIVVGIDQGVGYTGFYCDFYFDRRSGEFINHGVWE